MFESLSDPVDVLTAFVDGKIQPLRFRWKGRVIRVSKVTGRWNRREGQTRLEYFAIEDASSRGTFELSYDPRGSQWILTRAWLGKAEG